MSGRIIIYITIGFLMILAGSSMPQTALAQQVERGMPKGLCQPEVFSPSETECLNMGPRQYLTEMAGWGITFPLHPVPGTKPPLELVYVDHAYARIDSAVGTPVYGSLEDAVAGNAPLYSIEAGFDYVTYIDRQEVNGVPYYMIDSGVWVRSSGLSRISAMPNFQGRIFNATPKNAFGWVLFETQSKRTPGFERRDDTVRTYYRYNLLEIYHVTLVGDQEWYLIGPDEWIEGRLVASVRPNPTPPEGVDNGRWVEVNLAEQTIAVYYEDRMAFATLVATGVPGQWTQPGLFQAYLKKPNETMSGSFTADRSDYYYLEDVPWTVYFDQARALHGTYWHNSFGIPQSRGCVNLSPGDARWVFDWIQEGDWIYVWDPSGATPTDPVYYGSGGA